VAPLPRSIDAKTLAALGDLTLAARTVVDGFMFGAHHNRIPGAGLEFSQYRSYQPGDDPRRLDWKLFARSDRYFLRDAETDTSVTVRFVLDASDSMAQEEEGVTKLDYARLIVAALALLGHRQGDAVGLTTVSGGEATVLPPQRSPQHLHRLLHTLEQVTANGVWPDWERMRGLFTAGGARGILVIVTDLHERADEIRTLAAKLTALRHEVLVFHVMGAVERAFRYHGVVTFEELETGRRVEVDTDAVRASYLAALEQDLALHQRSLECVGVDYARFSLDQPLDLALRQYLVGRTRRR
jgi:uncharacterized protein (DUF58 family)